MKKMAIVMAVLAAVLISAPAWAQGIKGSQHDLSIRLGTGEICVSCHVPHNGNQIAAAAAAGANAPFWNHALSSATFQTTGHGRTSTKILGGNSLLCMGCHDGVTAVGNFNVVNTSITISDTTDPIQSLPVNGGQTSGFQTVNGISTFVNAIGTVSGTTVDLSNVHPVGIVYVGFPGAGSYETVGPGNLNAPSSTSGTGTVGTGAGKLNLEASTAYSAGVIGCTTCHDPHNTTNGNAFLAIPNTGSAICLTCHYK